jgi:hypothetical protein
MCAFCSSAPKQQLLTQHLRVHFCPLPELSDWLLENGQSERAQEVSDRVEADVGEAVKMAEKLQGSNLKRKLNTAKLAQLREKGNAMKPFKLITIIGMIIIIVMITIMIIIIMIMTIITIIIMIIILNANAY